MTNHFKALTNSSIAENAKVERWISERPKSVSLTDEAVCVMTDLSEVPAFSISASSSIRRANEYMIACDVRLLFVTAEDGELVGLITASDLLGEKPLKYISENGGTRDDITVNDMMTSKASLEALRLDDVASARVGDIVETMKICNRQHMLVVRTDEETQLEMVCGIFSSSQIGRLLGIVIEPSTRAETFAELEKIL